MPADEPIEQPNDETIVCLGCSRIVPAVVDFCPHCGVPLSPYSTIDPFKRVLAQGHMYWRLTHGPMKLAVTIVFAVLLIGGASVTAYISWKNLEQSAGGFWEQNLQILFLVMSIALPLALVVKAIRNHRRHKRSRLDQ